MRAQQQRQAKLLELKKNAEESKLEYELEDALAQEEGMSNNGDSDKELSELSIDSVNDRVSRLDQDTTENAVVNKTKAIEDMTTSEPLKLSLVIPRKK